MMKNMLYRPHVKIIAESLSQHDKKYVIPTPPWDKGRKKKTCDTKLHQFKIIILTLNAIEQLK
jgi:hypothetical protein